MIFATILTTLISFADSQHKHHSHKHREHKSHVHGAAKMNVAIDGNIISVEMSIPAHDLVGFEKQPKNKKQQMEADKARGYLLNATQVLGVNGCELKSSKIEGAIFGASATDSAKKDNEHSDVEVFYSLECAKIEEVKELTLDVFNKFKRIQTIDAVVVAEKASPIVLNAKNNKLKLK